MRSDMKKIVFDMPRYGSRYRYNNDVRRFRNQKICIEEFVDDDDTVSYEMIDDRLPSKLGMKPKRIGYMGWWNNRKEHSVNSRPFVRYLKSSVGNRWSTIYSDIRHNFSINSRQSFRGMKYAIAGFAGKSGMVYDCGLTVENYNEPYKSYGKLPHFVYWKDFIVDNGILCAYPEKKQMNRGPSKGWDRRWLSQIYNQRKHECSMERRKIKINKMKATEVADEKLRDKEWSILKNMKKEKKIILTETWPPGSFTWRYED